MADHTVQVHQERSDEVGRGGEGKTDGKQGGIRGINSQSLNNRYSERKQAGKIRALAKERVLQR